MTTRPATSSPSGARAAQFREAWAVPDFRALFAAGWISVIGDQFARVALALLVYQRTASAGWTAVTYALTFVPDLLGGPLLGGLADRYPRRRVMIVADVLRAGLLAAMALPGMPLAVMCTLLVLVQLAGSPAGAARAALTALVLPGDRFVAGQAAWSIMIQVGQVIGFATGGAVVVGLGVHGALLLDAATFVLSALVIIRWVRPAPDLPGQTAEPEPRTGWWRQIASGTRLVWSDRWLRTFAAAACVSGCFIAGEALAVPYAAELGGGPVAAGVLFGAYPLGTVIGSVLLVRARPLVRLRLLPVLVVAACVPLTVCAAGPSLAVVVVLFVCSGAASAYNVVASTSFMLAVPDGQRGQAFALAVTAYRVSQGVGVLAAGLAAERWPAGQVLAGAGVVGVLVAVGVVVMWWRAGGALAAAERVQPAVPS